MKEFWEKYEQDLKEGYYELKGGIKCLKPKFIVEYPKELVDILKRTGKNNTSQVRKYYEHVKLIQSNIRVNRDSFDAVHAWLKELIPYAKYALERSVITEEFVVFIELNIGVISDLDDLNAFAKHFQSLIAYMPKEKNR